MSCDYLGMLEIGLQAQKAKGKSCNTCICCHKLVDETLDRETHRRAQHKTQLDDGRPRNVGPPTRSRIAHVPCMNTAGIRHLPSRREQSCARLVSMQAIYEQAHMPEQQECLYQTCLSSFAPVAIRATTLP